MRADDPQTQWAWKRAQHSAAKRQEMMVGALTIMAASCIVLGFVLGRTTSAPSATHVAESPISAPASSGLPFKKKPERSTALASDEIAPSVVILNPGTADIAKQEEPHSAPNTRPFGAIRREIRNPEPRDKRPSEVPARMSGESGERAFSSTERDYHALRNYLLSR